MTTLGLIPLEVKRTLNLVTQQYKGHVTIVPQPKLSAYKNILINPNVQEYEEAIHQSYVCTLQKVSLIRAVYGVEREFDRYYMRLKHSLKVNSEFIGKDPNLIEYTVNRSIGKNIVWDDDDNEFEKVEDSNNELVCYLSKRKHHSP